MEEWIKSVHCASRSVCWLCRTNSEFRTWISVSFLLPEDWPACPEGYTAGKYPRKIAKQSLSDKLPSMDNTDFDQKLYISRRRVCRKCEHWTSDGKCEFYPRCAINFRKMIARPYAVCLDAKHRRWYYSTIIG